MPWCAVVQLIGQTACGVVYVGSGVRLDWSPAPDVVVRQMGSVVAGVPSLTRAQLSEAATAARCGVATADVNVGATAVTACPPRRPEREVSNLSSSVRRSTDATGSGRDWARRLRGQAQGQRRGALGGWMQQRSGRVLR
ncbi:hypothetical protein PMIN04_006654 [Paraphaeosphaeria minitans]